MFNCRSFISGTVAIALFVTQLPAAAQEAPVSDVRPLAEIKAQAQQDIRTYQKKFGTDKDLLPTVLAFTPLLRKRAIQLADEVDAAVVKKRYVFPYNTQQTLEMEQEKLIQQFASYLRDGKYYEAQKLMDQIGFNGWNFLRRTPGTRLYLPNDIEVFLNKEVPLTFVKGTAPAKEFYVGYYRGFDNLKVRMADAELFMEYNDIRDILTLLENTKNGKISPELAGRIRTIYQGSKWGAPRTFDKNIESAIEYIAKNQERLYTEPGFLAQYIDHLERTSLPKEIKRSLQANLLARGEQLGFSITKANGAFPFDIISLESKLTLRHSTSPLLRPALGSKFLPAVILLATIGIISFASEQNAQAKDIKELQRLQDNFDLFLEADPQTLEKIAQNKLADQYCRQQAAALHEAAAMSEQNASFVSQKVQDIKEQLSEQHQGQRVKQELVKSLKTVPAR